MSSRHEYVEREFKKWSEEYVIPFDQEFEVKALLDLQWQFANTADDYIKSKTDIIVAIQRLKQGLKLKSRKKSNIFYINVFTGANEDLLDRIWLYKMNLSEGKIEKHYFWKKDLEDEIREITMLVKEERPSQIIIDKTGKGLVVFDKLRDEAKKYNFTIDEKGNITYLD
jgi:hypothetical protein